MQIVIDIPDSLYENILICWENIHPKVWKILKDGTVLPKGHGRLIDEKTVYKKFYCQNLAKVAKEVLDDTPTVIEADKEEKVSE